MILLKMLLEDAPSSSFRMCKRWKKKGTDYWNGSDGRPKITIKVNDAGLQLSYDGPASGYNVSHANNGTTDTLHQAFNVIQCECNDYLIRGGIKPDVNNIKTNINRSNAGFLMNIWIPFTNEAGVWQISRRGGMGHDPGPNAVLGAIGNVENREGPVQVVVGRITEYFVAFTIADSNKVFDKEDSDTIKKKDSESDIKKSVDKKDNIKKVGVSSLLDKPLKKSPDDKKSKDKKDTPAETWYRYPEDKLYVYQQRGKNWYAKHINTGQEYNISANSKYKSSVDKLNAAKTSNKLTAVK